MPRPAADPLTSRRSMRWLVFVCALALTSSSGCNLITGADDLRVGEGGDGFDGSGAAAGSGATGLGGSGAGAGAFGGTGGTSAGGAPVGGSGSGAGPTGPLDYADGVAITDIDIYQALRRPLARQGQPASSDLPIVARRAATLRVFYRTEPGYNGQPVTVRLTVGGGAPVEQTATLSGTSSHGQLGSTVNLDVPGDVLTPGADFKVELLQPVGVSSGTNTAAAYPSSGATEPMGVEAGGVKLKILLVPVDNSGILPDTSPAQVQRYHTWFSEVYPIPQVEITVRANPYAFGGYLGSYQGWTNLLDEISDLRGTDGASDDVYYYGIHGVDAGGLLGLGWVAGPDDPWYRAAIGVGWTGDTAPETAIHEIGHTHGREHAPCGVSDPDPSFPHPGARLGVWGYSPSRNELVDPNQYVDFMSYCDPIWISDYTYKALFQRLKHVSASPLIHVPAELQNRTYDRVKVLDHQAHWKDSVTLGRPPVGRPISVAVTSAREGTRTMTASFFPYSDVSGGQLLVMRPRSTSLLDRFTQITFSLDGTDYTLTR